MSKLVFIGFGSIATCVLTLMKKKLPKLAKYDMVVIEPHSLNDVLILKEYQYKHIQKALSKDNYAKILNTLKLQKGDILLNLAYGVSTEDLVFFCIDRQINYLDTAMELWDLDPEWSPKEKVGDWKYRTLTHRQDQLLKNVHKIDPIQFKTHSIPTMILDMGMNPGLISMMVKHGLHTLATKVSDLKWTIPKMPNKSSMNIYPPHDPDNDSYSLIAYESGLRVIHCSERDTQKLNFPRVEGIVFNSWSAMGLVEEGTDPVEVSWGTHEVVPARDLTTQRSFMMNDSRILVHRGMNLMLESYEPMGGKLTGLCIPHGESISLSRYLRIKFDGQTSYRPTINYAYCLPDFAYMSMQDIRKNNYVAFDHDAWMVTRSRDYMPGGYDSVGALMMFENPITDRDTGTKSRAMWTGLVQNQDYAEKISPEVSATTLQVAMGCLYGLKCLMKNPMKGLLYPEDLPMKNFLNFILPEAGTLINDLVDYEPPKNLQFTEFCESVVMEV